LPDTSEIIVQGSSTSPLPTTGRISKTAIAAAMAKAFYSDYEEPKRNLRKCDHENQRVRTRIPPERAPEVNADIMHQIPLLLGKLEHEKRLELWKIDREKERRNHRDQKMQQERRRFEGNARYPGDDLLGDIGNRLTERLRHVGRNHVIGRRGFRIELGNKRLQFGKDFRQPRGNGVCVHARQGQKEGFRGGEHLHAENDKQESDKSVEQSDHNAAGKALMEVTLVPQERDNRLEQQGHHERD